MSKPLALIVDDEKSICESLSGVLSDEGWVSQSVYSGFDAVEVCRHKKYDLVFLDVWMDGMDGIEALQAIKEIHPDLLVVVMSGHGSIETAVKATRVGALDFLEKPLSLDKIIPLLEHAFRLFRMKKTHKKTLKEGYELIGVSEDISSMRRQIAMIAPRHSWVLITGENGTGKEVVARNIHLNSSRSNQPFVAVNCAAIPEDLIETELFGHAKGAFTHAVESRIGRFEQAHKGTLFLDEIGDMTLKTQSKILRILQEQSFEKVGGVETVSVDVRVIAATNKDLPKLISKGMFREDLYYRLNVIPLEMSPLRKRKNDVLLLIQHFMEEVALRLGEKSKKFSENAEKALQSYAWPGNVRELKNLVERLMILVSEEEIQLRDLPENIVGQSISAPKQDLTLREAKSHFERSFIVEKLAENEGNISKTAEAIGVERSNLHRKLKQYDIDVANGS
ncbi:MAG: sigma-54-dependent transcriptional regulator [Oligoflexales bacterium]